MNYHLLMGAVGTGLAAFVAANLSWPLRLAAGVSAALLFMTLPGHVSKMCGKWADMVPGRRKPCKEDSA